MLFQTTSIVLCLLASFGSSTDAQTPLQNANHIFNAIHSAMRQFGSSLNHNGMSLFIARVPEGTELYHGTSSSDRINGTEWLAFEPEHALIFARGNRGPPGHRKPPGGPPEGPPEHSDVEEEKLRRPDRGAGGQDPKRKPDCHGPRADPDEKRSRRLGQAADENVSKRATRHGEGEHDPPPHHRPGAFERLASQLPFFKDKDDEQKHGFLHTYRTKHDLRLLYLDGQSAAKSQKGTLDVQDLVLLETNPSEGRGGMGGEFERAQGLCRMAHERWEDRIDGVLRMEGGFEIILCSFEDHLDVARITQAKTDQGGMGRPGGGNDDDHFNYYEAVAARYDGIGGGRVEVDYNDFVTLFAIPDAVYTDETGRPRVRNESDIIEPLRKSISEMVLRQHETSTNWQAVADMVIARYADRIAYLTSGDLTSLSTLQAEIDRALRPFIDYGHRNASAEISRCASQFLRIHADAASTAARAVHNVTITLCSTLSAAAASDGFTAALTKLEDLKTWLAWTTWRRCQGCGYHEICFLPIWPVGSEEDFDKPTCRSNISDAPRGYWGGFGRPPH